MTNKNKPIALRFYQKRNAKKWKVINSEGKTLETFRTKPTAIVWKRKNELWFGEFSVVPIEVEQ